MWIISQHSFSKWSFYFEIRSLFFEPLRGRCSVSGKQKPPLWYLVGPPYPAFCFTFTARKAVWWRWWGPAVIAQQDGDAAWLVRHGPLGPRVAWRAVWKTRGAPQLLRRTKSQALAKMSWVLLPEEERLQRHPIRLAHDLPFPLCSSLASPYCQIPTRYKQWPHLVSTI